MSRPGRDRGRLLVAGRTLSHTGCRRRKGGVTGAPCPAGAVAPFAVRQHGQGCVRRGSGRCPIRQVSVPPKASRRSFIPGPGARRCNPTAPPRRPRCRRTCRRVCTSKRSTAGRGPIEGVGTAVAAFVGLAEEGPFNTPTLVSNWTQFTATFGGFVAGLVPGAAVYGYFLNGGGNCYVVRIGDDGRAPRQRPRRDRGASRPARRACSAATAWSRSTPAPPTGRASSVEVAAAGGEAPTEDMFKLVVKRGGQVVEEFDRRDHRPRQGRTSRPSSTPRPSSSRSRRSRTGAIEKPDAGTASRSCRAAAAGRGAVAAR